MKLLQVGRTKKGFWEDAIAHYQKRIRKYGKLELKNIDAAKGKKRSMAELQRIEERAIAGELPKTPYLILLDERGDSMGSEAFAKKLGTLRANGDREVTFVIGGAYGFSDSFRKKADMLLSLSPMTFSHQLVRVLFMEQLYRALSILHGDPYHNA